MYNGRNCDYAFSTDLPIENATAINLPAYGYFEHKYIGIENGNATFSYNLTSINCAADAVSGTFVMEEKTATSLFLSGTGDLSIISFVDSPEKSRRGWPLMTVLGNVQTGSGNITLREKGEHVRYNQSGTSREQVDIPANWYEVHVGSQKIADDVEVRLGGVYALIITQTTATNFNVKNIIVTEPNSMSMLWLIPQYVVITLGEVS